MTNKPDSNDWMIDLLKGLIQLTFKAINQAKEKNVEPEMLNAIRENILFLHRYFNGDL